MPPSDTAQRAASPPPAAYLHDAAPAVNAPTRAESRAGLCWDCDYRLQNLPGRHCPECGRGFDPADPSTTNAGGPLGWWGRRVLRPIGWRTFAAALAPMALVFWVATDPQLYYMGAEYFVCAAGLAAVPLAWLARWVARHVVVFRCGQPPSALVADGRRWRGLWAAAGLCVLVVAFKVPMRVAFLAWRPAFERLAAEALANPSAPLAGRRIGPYQVIEVTDYGTPGAPILLIRTSDGGGGFRYSPAGPAHYGYNPGDEGHLWGAWHWYSSD